MNEQLFKAFEVELDAIKNRLARERGKLEGIEDGEVAAIQRHRIAAIEAHLAEVTNSQLKIVLAENHVEETVKKFRTWRERVAAVRQAKANVEKFTVLISKAQIAVDQAENNFANARTNLTNHLNHPIPEPDYAAQSVIRRWESLKAELESAMQTRIDELRTSKQQLADLRNQWMKATQEFERAAFDERMARLPMPQRPQGVGILKAVS
jgi:hypothetical protein